MKTSTVAAIVFIAYLGSNAYAQRTATQQASEFTLDPDPVTDLEGIVDRFEAFFSRPQRLVFRTKDYGHILFYVAEYVGTNISYDVRKTDSLVSPFVGFILMTLDSRDNKTCGDVRTTTYDSAAVARGELRRIDVGVGWSSSAAAIDAQNRDECYKYYLGHPEPEQVRFEFSYQRRQWTFTRATRMEFGTPEISVSAATGLYVFPVNTLNESGALEFNRKWAALVGREPAQR